MQHNSCPGCGSPIAVNQKFCGICGTKLIEDNPVTEVPICSACSSPVVEGQQFCGICGTKLSVPDTTLAMSRSEVSGMTIAPENQNVILANAKGRTLTRNQGHVTSYALLNIGGAVFLILGWIILILGCIGSIALIVLAGMGGGFRLIFSDINILGTTAIIIGIAGLIVSLITGLEFLVVGRLCYALNDLIQKLYY